MEKISNTMSDLVVIDWMINNLCNYRCTYCSSELNDGSHQDITNEQFIEYFELIENATPGQNKKLIVTGGEPTLHKNFIELLSTFDKKWFVQVLTNGSRKLSWWEDFVCRLTQKNIKIIISFHPEYADENHIFNVCNLICKHFNTSVQILFHPEYSSKCYKMYKKILDADIKTNVKFKPIRNLSKNNVVINYNDKEKNIIASDRIERTDKINPAYLIIDHHQQAENKINSLIADKKNSFKNWKCEMGKNRFFIRSDGTVTGATCFTSTMNKVGNVKEMTFNRLSYTICQDDFCGCIEDIMIPKYEK